MTDAILEFLQLKKAYPSVAYLQQIITAYCSSVPWESVSKIIKKNSSDNSQDYVRLEDEFWNAALQYGTGGTCYESNWAFFYFLQNLGFEGYLTINEVVDKSSVHSAIVIIIDKQKYIVDIGYPLYAPIPIVEGVVSFTDGHLITYRCTPLLPQRFLIENFPHPKPYLYHLNDVPVDPKDYLKIASDDYGDAGLFSDRIIIRKLVNGLPTRFDSEDIPYNIHTLLNGEKTRAFIGEEAIINRLSKHFGLNDNLIKQAFFTLNKTTVP